MNCPSCQSDNVIFKTNDELRARHLMTCKCTDCNEVWQAGFDLGVDGTSTTDEVEAWRRLFAEQDGCCAICRTHQAQFNAVFRLDRDPITDAYTGLLCVGCWWTMASTTNGLSRQENYRQLMEDKNETE